MDEVKAAKSGEGIINRIDKILPIEDVTRQEGAFSEIQKSEMGKGEEGAYRRLREARSAARLVGVREKRAKAKAEEAQTQKK